jgi:beta-lactamase class A
VTARLRALVAASGAEVGLYYRSLAPDGDSITLDADLRMHAASTMKVPVMLQLYLDDATGRFDLDAPVEVTTRFTSIANGSPYDIDPASDSDPELYDAVGSAVPARHLLERMIIRSSNLATNLLIRHAGAARVTTTMRRLGADSIEVLRGVEDLAAFRAGLSNTTTARDLGVVFRSLADDGVASAQARAEMIGVLERQEYRSQIPAGVPPGTRVANKTGWITGIVHDAALVLPDGEHPPYVLVVLIRGFDDDPKGGEALAAALSREVWAYHTGH